jgi:pimeloyl-ACP methyl ester carboxylesterase
MQATTANVLGRKLHVLRGGTGKPVLYLHSAAGESQFPWPHFTALAERFEVHAPAHPGFLTSEGIDEIDGIEGYVDHYEAYLDAMGWKSVAVVGLSLGGWIGAELAARHPERVSELALVDAVGIWIQEKPIADIFVLDYRYPDKLRSMLFHDLECPAAKLMAPPPEGVEIPDEIIANMMRAMAATAKVGWNPLLHDPTLEHRLRRVKARTLCLWGAKDRVVPVEYGEKYAKLIAGAELEVVPDCGHMLPLEKPDAFGAAMRRFLR